MSTIKESLEEQCNIPMYAKDAKDCLLIHEYLMGTDKGHVWQSRWSPLVSTNYIGKLMTRKIYSPTDLGKLVVAQLRSAESDDKIDSIKRSVQARLDEVKQYPDHFKCSCRDVRLILEEILNIIEG